MARPLQALLLVALVTLACGAQRKSRPSTAEALIEEVTAKQLDRLLEEKDFVAVFWYARSCVTCDKVLEELEKIDDDTDSFGVDFVKINDKRLAKQYGITKFPALTYFREKEPIIYEGDLMDEESVLDFLTSLEAMDLPDRIEEVNQKILSKIIADTDYVAVLFYKPECKRCAKALQELENIDDEADQLGIGFVKIHDEDLAEEYSLGDLPKLVYYRHEIPIIYEGELSKEEDVLEWLIANKSTGDEEDVIEDVTAKTLNTLIGNVDNLVVLFYDHGDDDSMTVLAELEKIDDDCDKHGIQFVKIDDEKAANSFGIDSVPAIVYFEKQIPNVYDGDLENEDEILEWLVDQLEKDEIEDVTDEMLDRLIKEGKTIAVLFYDNNDRKSQKVLNELENIDDECDQLGIAFVKIDNMDEAKEYGIEKIPSLLYFEKGIPTLYTGNLEDEDKVLAWLKLQTESDEIEDITDEMLDLIIEKMPHVAVLFYDKDQKKSQKVLAELENIDDDCDQNDIAFVKIDDDKEAKEYGIDKIPTIVLFEKGIPHIYEGDLMKEEELLGWLIHQKRHSEIPEVTDEMMEKLIETTEFLAVIFYDKDDKQDIRILNELENIDDELEKEGIVIVRMDNDQEAKEFGIDHLPTLVYFEDKIPAIYEGDLMNEEEVLKWLIEQKNSATIEEVTDEILEDLIEEHEYVVVYFSGKCNEGDECDNILEELENIDDELDETGIIFVTTEDLKTAKKYGIKTFPTLVFFRNKDPLFYKGDLEDEDEVLSWLTDEDTLEIPGKIEEVNSKMLEKILEENDHVVVFFYQEGDKKAQKILSELENIDDECEDQDIDFVKTSDEGIDKEYDLNELPALAYYRHKFRTIYDGDLMHEEAILEWVLDLHDSQPDVIESVDRKTLKDLINDVEHLAVFFYSDQCDSCAEILDELETIDDDTDKHGIQFVKSKDSKLASELGIFSFPALVYYETGVPIMYDGSSIQLGMVFGGFLCFVCFDPIGRKKSHLLTIVPTIFGWVVITFATNTLTIIFARFVQGLASGLRVPLTSIIIGESTAPRYRGGFLATATSSLSFGIFLAHLIGTFYSWRIIAIASTVISLLSLVIIFIVPDSPTWLAKVGRTEEAYKAFRWFRGDGAKATMEFEKILINLKHDETQAFNCDLLKALLLKEFYKPFLLMTAVSVAYQGSGINVMAHYTMDIISEVFDSDAANSYVMLAVDVLRIVCSLIGCIIMKKFNRRTVFHASASCVMVALLTMSLYIYLQNTYGMKRDEVLVAAIFLYIFGAGSGVQAMTYVLFGEIFPVNLRGIGGGISVIFFGFYGFGVLLLVPYMFHSIGREGTFLTYAGFLALSWLYIYFFMPETNNKTLVDIELKLKECEKTEELQSLNASRQIVNNS